MESMEKQVVVRLPSEIWKNAKARAEDRGLPLSTWVRMKIVEIIKNDKAS